MLQSGSGLRVVMLALGVPTQCPWSSPLLGHLQQPMPPKDAGDPTEDPFLVKGSQNKSTSGEQHNPGCTPCTVPTQPPDHGPDVPPGSGITSSLSRSQKPHPLSPVLPHGIGSEPALAKDPRSFLDAHL